MNGPKFSILEKLNINENTIEALNFKRAIRARIIKVTSIFSQDGLLGNINLDYLQTSQYLYHI